jgi:hypothetical protein
MKAVREAIDNRLVGPLAPASFVQFDGILVPRESLPETLQPLAAPAPSGLNSFVTPEDDDGIDEPGYVVDLRRYRLPEIHLTPAEVAAQIAAILPTA